MKNSFSLVSLICLLGLLGTTACGTATAMPSQDTYTNSIGMKFVSIEPGTYRMGQIDTPLPDELLWIISARRGGRMNTFSNGDFDERPVHEVTITKPFYVATTEVTNYQYEVFDPEHKKLRGKDNGLSKEDNEAVINVNFYNAQAFCRWLSDQEGLNYRLPTEAEWEYACRAGTSTNYHTGDILPDEYHKNAVPTSWPQPASLVVGETPPNKWGLYDMHGNVEEWCSDWYGPYKGDAQSDPVGYAEGSFRVLRGGSHGTPIFFLRSANRMGALPEDKHWLIGFRVVIAELPGTQSLPAPRPPLHQRNVIQRDPESVKQGPDPNEPYFKGPRKYVRIPKEASGPIFAGHNHDPAIVECPNGDLLSVWYTCVSEKDRELGLVASRLRWGSESWEPADVFFDSPDRNDHAPVLGFDGNDTIYHLHGISPGASYSPLAMVMRSSKDSGATWSKPRLVLPEHKGGQQPSEPFFVMNDGTLALAVDGGDTLWMSRDKGQTWLNPGGDIPGIHTGVDQLADDSIIAYSRSGNIDGMMPKAISTDLGKSFTSEASEFAPIGGGKRLVLLRLNEGPLLFGSFAANEGKGSVTVTDSSGKQRQVRGFFVALSEDNGKTWPYKRLLTDDKPGRTIECTDGGAITLSSHSAEYRGYFAICQSTDNLINIISSRNHYAFNLAWIKSPPPPAASKPVKAKKVVETFSGPEDFDTDEWVIYKGFTGGFNGKGQYHVNSKNHFDGINRVVGEGSFEAVFSVKNIEYKPYGEKTPPGISLGFKDPFSGSMLIQVQADNMAGVTFDEPLKAATLKFIYDQPKMNWKVFYGLNGDEPTTELPSSIEGINQKAPTSESLAAMLLLSNCSADIDHFQVTPK